MLIPVCGMDPSMRNWGLASALLHLTEGHLTTPHLEVIKTAEEPKGKQVRQNSYDLEAAQALSQRALAVARQAKAVFVEVPHGSQSASGMKGYGICIGILGAIRAEGIPIIEVSESESKKNFAGKRTATKEEMIQHAMEWYPNANWPTRGGKLVAGTAEHMADAIAAIHAGVHTPMFQNLMRLYAKV